MSNSQRSANVNATGDEDVDTRCYALALTGTTAGHFSEVQGVRAVSIVNPVANSVAVLVGDNSLQVVTVYPGDDPFRVRCTRLDQVYVKNASSATQTVYGVAEVRA